eukprot:4159454-Amphidinium_carterae.1
MSDSTCKCFFVSWNKLLPGKQPPLPSNLTRIPSENASAAPQQTVLRTPTLPLDETGCFVRAGYFELLERTQSPIAFRYAWHGLRCSLGLLHVISSDGKSIKALEVAKTNKKQHSNSYSSDCSSDDLSQNA